MTDPEISKGLFQTAKSCDKEIKLYPGLWHGLTAGESDDDIERVYSDIIHWLNKHSPTGSVTSSPLRHADISALEAPASAKPRELEAKSGKVTDEV